MTWETLFSPRRTGDAPRKDANPDRLRTSYIRDYDRLIFSSAFRRLQNKTQVFPLPGAVFVHNRLTHSLEVSSVGRSLGKAAGEAIAGKHFAGESSAATDYYRHELGSVVSAACLAHDIGNPPFGHGGEDAIRTYFCELEGDERRAIHDALSPEQRADFEHFEGNANAFRLMTQSFGESEDPGGYKLTYATLAAVVKYPCTSASGFRKDRGLSGKKSGFFLSELDVYRDLADTFSIPRKGRDAWARHPAVFLTEAADDVCYRVIDLEDAHRLHIITLREFEDLFLPFFERESGYNGVDYVRKKAARLHDDNQKVQFLRAKWIGLMVERLTGAFLAEETALLSGELETDLLCCLPPDACELVDRINEFSVRRIYNHRSVAEVEVAGYHVIGGLLKEFVEAVLSPTKTRSRKTLGLMPRQFHFSGVRGDLYADIQSVVDYISGMTDLYAIDLYRKMTGISVSV